MSTALIVTQSSAPLVQLEHASAAANRAAASHLLSAYAQRRPANTLRRQRANLERFVNFLATCGIDVTQNLAHVQ